VYDGDKPRLLAWTGGLTLPSLLVVAAISMLFGR
jgi:hypothetical protein